MNIKKEFTSSVQVDFTAISFYQIPFAFFAEWLHLVLEISKIIQPGFEVDIPKKQFDWYNFPDRSVFDPESGAAYTLRTTSLLLTSGEHRIHLAAQYGYENIPGRHIIVTSNLSSGSLFSRNLMRENTIEFDLELDEQHCVAVEEVFYIFQ